MRKLEIYFQNVTPESAAFGEFSSQGHHDTVTFEVTDTIEDVAQYISRNFGCVEDGNAGYFTTIDGEENYATGESTQYTIHPKNFSSDEIKLLTKLLN